MTVSKIASACILGTAALLAASAFAAQEITLAGSQSSANGSAEYFTGHVVSIRSGLPTETSMLRAAWSPSSRAPDLHGTRIPRVSACSSPQAWG
jgi:hypothetical protein